jgi:hypothetical protein
MTAELYLYRCPTCRTVAVAAAPRLVRCCLCRSRMAFLYPIPIETDEQRRWAARGLVYNPHAAVATS